MLQKINKLLGPTGKLIGTIVLLTTTAYGAINFIYKKAYEKAQEDSKNILIEQDVKEIKNTTDSILIAVKSQSVKINEISTKQEETKEAYNALRSTVLDHLGKDKSMTIEQFKQYMESTPELKKNSSPIGTSQ